MVEQKPILVLGATGYVGGRLVPRLLEKGYRVRAAGRSIEKLRKRSWASHSGVELVQADVQDEHLIRQVAEGCSSAYYLVHSMLVGVKDFAQTDVKAARQMRQAAEEAGLSRIIYLGGLGETSSDLSKHLRSRAEVGAVLSAGSVPVTTLRAAMIIGSGSASFEILRYLVERLPVMITPSWVNTKSQPIAIRDVIEYLVACLECDQTAGRALDIGGRDIVTYHELMDIFAREAGLPRRWVVPVPVLTPRLSSGWIHLVTPVPASIARPLVEGLCNEVVCQSDEIHRLIPLDVLGCDEAIRLALRRVHERAVATHWADAGQAPHAALAQRGDPEWSGGTIFEDIRVRNVDASVEEVWAVIRRIGGETGWYQGNWLWVIRGMIDKLIGGVGLRRGRRHPIEIEDGDALDFWRVIRVEENRQLLLAAEMKLPGQATLEFRVENNDEGKTRLLQSARFRPRGLWGLIYWWAVCPLHAYIFGGMIARIARKAELLSES